MLSADEALEDPVSDLVEPFCDASGASGRLSGSCAEAMPLPLTCGGFRPNGLRKGGIVNRAIPNMVLLCYPTCSNCL